MLQNPAQDLDDVVRLEHEPEHALEQALSGLARAANDLGADTLAMLVLEAASVEITYRRTETEGRNVPAAPPGPSVTIDCGPELRDALANASGPVSAESPAGRFLKAAVAPSMNSFALFPWPTHRRSVVVVFGFSEPQPKHRSIPAHIKESLNLAALAAWSLKEVNLLRTELRAMNDRLAGQKLVERVKSLLQAERGMNEPQAYEYLRKISRQRRIKMAKVAEDLLGTARCP